MTRATRAHQVVWVVKSLHRSNLNHLFALPADFALELSTCGVMAPKRKPLEAPKEALDVTDLAEEWDGCEEIRGRLRNGETFLHPNFTTEDCQGCIYNASILVPLLTRMSVQDNKPLPPIQELRNELNTVFEKNKRGSTPEDAEEILKSGWSLKKCCGFIKMKCRREEVSTAT